jgi:hypothetical protein
MPLSNLPVRRDAETEWHSHLLEEQPVALVGPKPRGKKRFVFPVISDRGPFSCRLFTVTFVSRLTW